MQPRTPTILWDIQDSASFIFLQIEGKTFDDFVESRALRRIAERELEVIGEASRRLRDHDPATAARLPGLSEALGARNVIAHEYDNLKYDQLWETVNGPLRDLAETATSILQEYGPPGGKG
jgi:uncharacterized protein with HEPN domain